MAESIFLKPISKAFAIVSFIESLIWSVLSFLAILCVYDVIKYDRNEIKDDLKQFIEYLYVLYFSDNKYPEEARAINQTGFHVIIWVYFVISLFWCFSSAVQLSVLSQNAKTRKFNVSTIIFLTLSYSACVYDAISMLIFAVDYHRLKDFKPELATAASELELAVPIMLMILVAKGFVLWIVNVVFAIIVTVMFAQKAKRENFLWVKEIPDPSVYARNNLAYNAYGEEPTSFDSNASRSEPQTWLSKISIERFKLSNLSFFGKDVASIVAEDTKSATSWSRMPRSNSITSQARPSISYPVLNSSSNPNTISRPVSGSPIYQSVIVDSSRRPAEPEPDYSPQVGRKAIFSPQPPLRSALKRI